MFLTKDAKFASLVAKFIELTHFMGLNYSTLFLAVRETESEDLLYHFNENIHKFLEYLDDYVTQGALLCSDYTVGGISQRIESILWNRALFYSRFRNFRFFIKARLCFASKPRNYTRALQSMYCLSDSLWHVVGDTAMGFSFYTKRATLMGLHAAFMLKFANDYSYEFEKSRSFLRERIRGIVAFSKMKARLSEGCERFFGAS